MPKSLIESLVLPGDRDISFAERRLKYQTSLAVQEAFNELEKAREILLIRDCSGLVRIQNQEKAVEYLEKAKAYDFAITDEFFSSYLDNLPVLSKLLDAFNYGHSCGEVEAQFARERIRSTHSMMDNPAWDRIQERKNSVIQIRGYLGVYSKLVKMSSVNIEVVSEPLVLAE